MFDRAIIGSGDSIFCFAVAGALTDWRQAFRPSTPYRDGPSWQEWQQCLEHHSPKLNCIRGAMTHLVDGRLEDRRYFNRHLDWTATGCNAERDLIAADHEAWSFAPSCPIAVRELMQTDSRRRSEDS